MRIANLDAFLKLAWNLDIKFLPWQLGHIGTIRGIYTNFDTVAIIFTICSMVLAIVLLVMGLVRRDKRHLGDLIAGTQTQVR